jgi:anti-sigma B factor antagonist
MEFGIEREQREGIPLLRVRGELDVYTAPKLKEVVREALEDGAPSLAFDLSSLQFMDSTGLQILMSAKKRTAERGGEVYVFGLRSQIRRVFDLLGLERIFRIGDEVDLPGS